MRRWSLPVGVGARRLGRIRPPPTANVPLTLGSEGGGPAVREEVGLFKDGGGGLLLLVWGVAVLAEGAFDDDAKLGAGGFSEVPVYGGVAAHDVYELAGDGAEGVITQDLDGGVVGF